MNADDAYLNGVVGADLAFNTASIQNDAAFEKGLIGLSGILTAGTQTSNSEYDRKLASAELKKAQEMSSAAVEALRDRAGRDALGAGIVGFGQGTAQGVANGPRNTTSTASPATACSCITVAPGRQRKGAR